MELRRAVSRRGGYQGPARLPSRAGRYDRGARLTIFGKTEPRRGRSYHVLVNDRAGTVLEVGAANLRSRLERGFAAVGASCEVHFGAVADLEARLGQSTDADVVPVLVGGDGTVTALLRAILKRDLPVGVLPLGTLNLLARDLGFLGPLEADISTLHHGTVRRIDLGSVNGTLFHSASGLGFALDVANERERTRRQIPFSRGLATVVATLRALVRIRPVEVEVEIDGRAEQLTADAVLVTNNMFEGTPWRRACLDAGTLEVLLLRASGAVSRSRAALAVVSGEWRNLEHLKSLPARKVVLRRSGNPARTQATLDGEIGRFAGDLDYSILPGALKIIGARTHSAYSEVLVPRP
ncbi:MAG: diacylglycerol kinase family protein [Geminicoccaceae bacterium]